MQRKFRRIVTLCILLLLALLFTLPRMTLSRACREMEALIAEAGSASLAGQDPSPALNRLQAVFDRYEPTFQLFLDHGSIDAAGAAIAAATPLTDPSILISALHTVSAALEHLMSIESLSVQSLL